MELSDKVTRGFKYYVQNWIYDNVSGTVTYICYHGMNDHTPYEEIKSHFCWSVDQEMLKRIGKQ